jgi:signal transduction histidine kinase
LLQQERETAADLSHQLRTPLTALRLDIEALDNGDVRTRLLDDVDELSRHVDFVIREARREVRRQPGVSTDIIAMVETRLAFWRPLAEEQGRSVAESIPEAQALVDIPGEDAEAMIDALIGNIFAHTPEGSGLAIDAALSDTVSITIADDGPGFADGTVVERGVSGSDSTGLGLDIARRTAESAGGTMAIGRSTRLSGAEVVIRLPIAE